MVKFAKVCQVCLYIPLLMCGIFALSMPTSQASAQGVILTPTPLPAIVATQQAAESSASAAQATLQQAAQMEAQAAQMKRNGEAQQAQAQADINSAREAQAAQNGAAVGEAIGRVEATLNQLRDTVNGQAQIIESLTAENKAQAATIISLTNTVQTLQVDKQTISAAYAATVAKAEESGKSNTILSIVQIGGVVLFVCLLSLWVITILQRKGQRTQVTYDATVIDAEVSDNATNRQSI